MIFGSRLPQGLHGADAIGGRERAWAEREAFDLAEFGEVDQKPLQVVALEPKASEEVGVQVELSEVLRWIRAQGVEEQPAFATIVPGLPWRGAVVGLTVCDEARAGQSVDPKGACGDDDGRPAAKSRGGRRNRLVSAHNARCCRKPSRILQLSLCNAGRRFCRHDGGEHPRLQRTGGCVVPKIDRRQHAVQQK